VHLNKREDNGFADKFSEGADPEIIKRLEVLANDNRKRAFTSLIAIICIFIFSLTMFFFSDKFSNPESVDQLSKYRDATQHSFDNANKKLLKIVSDQSVIEVEIKEVEDQLNYSKLSLASLNKKHNEILGEKFESIKASMGKLDEIDDTVNGLEKDSYSKALNIIGQLEIEMEALENESFVLSGFHVKSVRLNEEAKSSTIVLEGLSNELKEIQKLNLERLKTEKDEPTSSIVSSIITRLGGVMLSVLMLQIFLTFYRYFLRLANHYDSKVVAAESALNRVELNDVINSIDTERITFGKNPELPIEKIMDLIKLSK